MRRARRCCAAGCARAQQLHPHHGLPLPLEIRHDEFTIDIPENQILRTACERMLSVPRVDAESQRMLRRLLRDFGDVTPIPRVHQSLLAAHRLNARYHAALRLAVLVLRRDLCRARVRERRGERLPARHANAVRGVRHRRPARGARTGVRRARGRSGPEPLRRGRSGAAPAGHRLEGRRSAVAVIDAKYKAEKPAGYPNADLYQLLAYCTVLGLPVGHLVYAKGNEEPARHVVRQSGVEIFCHAIDLSHPPGQLIGEMSNLAEVVTAMAITSCRYPVRVRPRL